MRLLFMFVLLIGALLVFSTACESAGSQNPNVFGFTIPEGRQTLDQALEFVREQEDAKGQELVKTSEIILTAYGGSVPEQTPPDIFALVLTETGEEYSSVQEEWTGHLTELFDRWNICAINIGWNIPSGTFEDLGLDRQQAIRTPGCD